MTTGTPGGRLMARSLPLFALLIAAALGSASASDVAFSQSACELAAPAHQLGQLVGARFGTPVGCARVDADGDLVPLESQDRASWDTDETNEGLAMLDAALRRGQPSVRIAAELTRACVQQPVIRADGEKAGPGNGEIERITRLAQIALRLNNLVRHRAYAETYLQAGRHLCLRIGHSARLNRALVHQVIEFSPPHLIARGVGVR